MKGVYLVTRTVWIREVARQKESRWRTDNLRAGDDLTFPQSYASLGTVLQQSSSGAQAAGTN